MALPKPETPDRASFRPDPVPGAVPDRVAPPSPEIATTSPTKPAKSTTRRRPPVTDETPVSNAKSLFGPGFPIQLTKVQRPPLRVETLSRVRLLDWLAARMQQRLVFISAEAGYGKTTLIADFARRTRLRVLWYRLDEQDRDWIAVLNYLVASGREIEPDFAPATAALLSDVGTGTASRERVVETFVRELQTLGRANTVLFIDDWHLVDGIADVRELMREVVVHAPERLTFVFASRRRPTLSVARFRALGEVAELTTADLRFSEDEIERLFRDTYGRPLEADVVNDLSERTEGWAASLQLVQTALRDRTPSSVRTFVRELSGIDSDLYDYLAEEVVGDLDEETQQFLMRTSILRTVDPDLTSVVTGFDAARARQLIEAAEKLGLLSRRGEATRHSQRYHTLVREFLEDRLRRATSDEAVRDLHRAVARHADGSNWRLAAHHYEAAGDIDDVHRVIDSSALEIMSAGDYAAVAEWLDRYPPDVERAIHHITRSRINYNSDRSEQSIRDAEAAAVLAQAEGGLSSELAQLNLLAALLNAGEGERSAGIAARLRSVAKDTTVREILDAYLMMAAINDGAAVRPTLDYLDQLAARQMETGRRFFAGVSLVNLAVIGRSAGDAARVRSAAERAYELLAEDKIGPEAAAAASAMGWSMSHLYGIDSAVHWFEKAVSVAHEGTRLECIAEYADAHLWYGSIAQAKRCLGEFNNDSPHTPPQLRPTRIELLLRENQTEAARELMDFEERSGRWWPKTGRMAYLGVLLAVLTGRESAIEEARSTSLALNDQGFLLWQRPCRLLIALDPGQDADAIVHALAAEDPASLSHGAEAVVQILPRLSEATLGRVATEAQLRPLRWRDPLREALEHPNQAVQLAAANLLELVGAKDDVTRLRHFSRKFKSSAPEARLGKKLARVLADTVFIEDQGRLRLKVGNREIDGSSVRRKVLSLLGFLLTRPGFSATRDQVLDALWPDLEPEVAANSLHQTVYFLRRVFEPAYKEDLSADYVHHDSDLVWLDSRLISSRSGECGKVIARIRSERDPALVEDLSGMYAGTFALDFEYEEWATEFRTSLHSDYVELIERSAQADAQSGHLDRGIALLARALEVDPEADQLELMLLKLLRRAGAHAAAAERYEHYAAVMKDQLGVDPPPLNSLE